MSRSGRTRNASSAGSPSIVVSAMVTAKAMTAALRSSRPLVCIPDFVPHEARRGRRWHRTEKCRFRQ